MIKDYPISASQVKKWKKCPKQFWYRYISDIEIEDDGSKFTEMGNAVHESIEEFLKGDPDLSDKDHIEERLHIQLTAREDNFEYGEDMDERANQCIENAAKYLEWLHEQGDEIRGIELDHEYEKHIPGTDRPFRAIMDLATDKRIVDWKTGNKGAEKVQAGIYIEGYKDKYGEYPEQVHFVYLKEDEVDVNIHNAETDEEVYWGDKVNQYWQEMVPHVQSMHNAMELENYPADPGESKCYWCAYSYHCPDSGVGVADIPWDAFR